MSGAFEALSGAKGIRAAGKNQQIIADYNAKVAEANAKAERIRSNFDQIQQAKEAERIKGSLAANLGAAGGTGTPVGLDLTGEQAGELELENLLIGFEGEARAGQLEQQAIIDRMQGQAAMSAAKSQARAANVGFGMQLGTLAFLGASAGGAGAGVGNAGSATTSSSFGSALSDVRFKENIEKIDSAISKVCQLNGYTYNYIMNDESNRNGGVMAQELEEVLPDAVSDENGVKFVRYDAVIGLLVEAVKELNLKVSKQLQREI